MLGVLLFLALLLCPIIFGVVWYKIENRHELARQKIFQKEMDKFVGNRWVFEQKQKLKK